MIDKLFSTFYLAIPLNSEGHGVRLYIGCFVLLGVAAGVPLREGVATATGLLADRVWVALPVLERVWVAVPVA